MPRITVIVCTYNNAASLKETLGFLAKQNASPSDFEIIVVTNNCTDDTASVIKEFATRLPQLSTVAEPRQGQVFTRVRGVRESRSDWVAFVDDDNYLKPDWIRQSLDFLADHPNAGVVGGRVEIVWESEPPPAVEKRSYAFASTDLGNQPRELQGEDRWRIRGAGMVCRKDALRQCGWLAWQANVGRVGRGTTAGDDTEIVMRIAREGWEIWYEPGCHLLHSISTRRLTNDYVRSLHFGFALADPVLLGLKTRGNYSTWAASFLTLILRRFYWLIRHSLKGLTDIDSRETAHLTRLCLQGNIAGLSLLSRMSKQERGWWMGDTNIPTSSENASRRLRVLHLERGNPFGGLQQMLLCIGLERDACPEMESVFALCHEDRLSTELRKAGCFVKILGPVRALKPWQVLRSRHRLKRYLASRKFDVAICHGSWTLALYASVVQRMKVPLVMWVHNDTKVVNINVGEFLAGRIRPDLVISNSAFTASSLPLLFPRQRPLPANTVIHCPVSLPKTNYRSSPNFREKLRRQYNTALDAIVIITASRLEPWKGHVLLLEAFTQLRETPGWICWIAGGPHDAEQKAYHESLHQFVDQNFLTGHVRFLGQSDRVPELLAAADIHCQPNLTPEPFGITFVEALYAGLPVVSTNHGGVCEIVDASSGRLVPPNNPTLLAEALKELITNTDLRRNLSENAIVRGKQISDPTKILEMLKMALLNTVRASSSDIEYSFTGLSHDRA